MKQSWKVNPDLMSVSIIDAWFKNGIADTQTWAKAYCPKALVNEWLSVQPNKT